MQSLRNRLGGTGTHPLNGRPPTKKTVNYKKRTNATSARELYKTQMKIGGRTGDVQLPPVRTGEVAPAHGNRFTMTQTADTVGKGGYSRVLSDDGKRRGLRGHALGQFMEQGMKTHHRATQEVKSRKYDRLRRGF
jgi:hypothetical protein